MTNPTYADLGWTAHFARQADADTAHPLRIAEIHRTTVAALAPDGLRILRTADGTGALAVGDWIEANDDTVSRIYDRQSLLKRRAAGTDARVQLIAANVTTLGIVTSCNADFNERRIERYLVLAADAGCLPLVILTKADQTDAQHDYIQRAQRLSPMLTAIAIDATDPLEVKRLHPWCRTGDTLALVGSSGVGKTTIRNALTGESAATQDTRQDDAKGRHTTTSRTLVRTSAGGWLIDTPGMRALRLADATDGIDAIFSDIDDLAQACRFSDCAHDTEPGCAVRAAIEDGTLDEGRLGRWRKLLAEDMRNSETIAQARARDKGFGKMVRGVMARKRTERGD
ncbi:MAG: ribosome small subunit-dependent GTPase A [Silicimonas sp.]|nr:ribosome small subunit-dependent GTPase A [Silicimonas sp.]